MIDEKKIELMKKLQRLAERGVGGEKEGAQKKLQQLMKKYNIEESDLSDDKLEDHEWKYHNDFELRLLKQTIYKVLGKDGLNQMYHYRSGKGKKTIQGVQCTKAQAIQIGIEYEFYCETWKEEHDFLRKRTVQGNRNQAGRHDRVRQCQVLQESQRDCSTLEGLLRGVRRRKVQHFCKGLQTERQAICTAEGEPRHINVSDSDTGKETA